MANYDFALFTGHGSGDPGATNGSFIEHSIAQQIVNVAKTYLNATGKNILYGNNNYRDKLLQGHTISSKAALSVHLNSVGDKSVKGTEVWVPAKEKFLDADSILARSISEILNTNNRGIRSKNYNTDSWNYRVSGHALDYTDWMGEIRDAWSRGVALSLLEVGFISNDAEAQNIINNIQEIGKAVAKYACECMGVPLPELNVPKPDPIDWKSLYEAERIKRIEAEDKIRKIKEII